MTSLLAVMGRMATSDVALPGRSLMSMNALLCLQSKNGFSQLEIGIGVGFI